ncbi:HsdM family class I SAM-dependent methyltransferase [Roseateles sp. L2-2]|uniref:HsdM family class I SAM-dependent methyltransferase n=1 Tax=Roseateles sp. L2-2 TaxID=3422597 RepID=UPI003D36676B
MAEQLRSDGVEERKARGAFFTPPEIARFMVDWAVRSKDDAVLEPSCGEAAFLLPAAQRLHELGATRRAVGKQLHAGDIHHDSVAQAHQVLASEGFSAQIEVGDFFLKDSAANFDAVIGNPPYVRYQDFSGASRAASLQAALRQGVRLTQLASSWAAFTVHASAFLRPTGRLALVIPAELLSVKYAAQIRRFLLDRFASVRLVLFETLVFPGVLEDVVLLLAEGSGGAQSFEVFQARTAQDLATTLPKQWLKFEPAPDEKWTGALVSSDAYRLYDEAAAGEDFEAMSEWGATYLGAVTGHNDFFTLTQADVEQWKLPPSELVRISPPGARHLRGLSYSAHDWRAMAAAGERCFLFAPGTELSRAARRYIAHGEALGVPTGYKCRVRDPWWTVPMVAKPDLLMPYMNHERPRLVRNGAGVQVLNSLYGVKLKASRKKLGQELLPLAMLNSLTLLGAEIVGRAYGGGLLKHEPKEASRLPLPSETVLAQVATPLKDVQKAVGALLARNDLPACVAIVDTIVLRQHLGWSEARLGAIREARVALMQRRLTRGKGKHGQD